MKTFLVPGFEKPDCHELASNLYSHPIRVSHHLERCALNLRVCIFHSHKITHALSIQ